MKRLVLVLIALVTLQAHAMAATAFTDNGCRLLGDNVYECTWTYVDDTAGYTDYALSIPAQLIGTQPGAAIHIPGTTTMTETADITIEWRNVSIFGTSFDNCGGATPTAANYSQFAPAAMSTLTLTIANNAVNNATGTVAVYF